MLLRILVSILLIIIGAGLFYLAELDDSPGGQLIGLIIALLGVVKGVKIYRKK